MSTTAGQSHTASARDACPDTAPGTAAPDHPSAPSAAAHSASHVSATSTCAASLSYSRTAHPARLKTRAQLRHPEQAERWTWLVLAAYTQLRLARALVADRRLPWERRHPPGRRTPNRVRRAVPAQLLALGSPARMPQPCGRSSGRPQGHRSGPAPRHPAIKKAA